MTTLNDKIMAEVSSSTACHGHIHSLATALMTGASRCTSGDIECNRSTQHRPSGQAPTHTFHGRKTESAASLDVDATMIQGSCSPFHSRLAASGNHLCRQRSRLFEALRVPIRDLRPAEALCVPLQCFEPAGTIPLQVALR